MKRNCLHSSLCAMLALLLFAPPVLAGDWYQWRGPEQNGVSRERGLPDTFDPDTGKNVLWSNDVGGMSSPIVMNGKAFVMSRIGEDQQPDTLVASPRTQEIVACVDAESGKRLWEYRENPTQTEVPFHRLGWGSMVGDPKTGRVYAFFVHCSLVCLDGDTGKLIWKRQLTEEFGTISTFGGRTSSPAIDEDQIFIAGVSFGWGDHARSQHRIFAFNKENGELNWSNGTGGTPVDAPYNTPVISVIGGQRLAVFSAGDGGVHAFQARTGKRVWSYKVSKRGMNSSVLVDGNRIYATSSEENTDNPKMGRVVCIDAGSGQPKLVWEKVGIEAGFPSHTLYGGRYYVLDNSATLYALDANDGKQYWKKKVGTIGKGSLVFADGKLYVPEANGKFSIIKPQDSKAEVLTRTEFTEKLGREYVIFGSVAVANGRIYLQTANHMFCIGEKDRKPVPDEPMPPQAKEAPADPNASPALVQVRPYDLALHPGEKVQLTAWAFDDKGRALGQAKQVQWSVGQLTVPATQPSQQPTQIDNLKGQMSPDGAFTAGSGGHMGGAVIAKVGQIAGNTRVRVFPPLPWKFDFQQSPVGSPPLTWLGAGGKFAVLEETGKPENKSLAKLINLDLYYRARTNFGTEDMANYTVKADVKVGQKNLGGNLQMPDPGILNQRYMLVLLGNHQRLQIQLWPPTLPMSLNKTIDFPWKPDTWYSMKLRVDQLPDKAVIKGKVWPTGSQEPKEWNVELEDPQPNRNGNPGLFGHSLVAQAKSLIWYDNIEVTDNQ